MRPARLHFSPSEGTASHWVLSGAGWPSLGSIRLRVGFNQAGALPENRGRERTRKFMGFARCGLGLVMADDKTIIVIVGI